MNESTVIKHKSTSRIRENPTRMLSKNLLVLLTWEELQQYNLEWQESSAFTVRS